MRRLIRAYTIWASTEQNLSSVFENNKGTDHPAHWHSLISAFVIHLLESIISKLSTSKLSTFLIVSVAEHALLVAQSVTCLATDACLTVDPGVASSIPARSHTFVEIDHEIISTVILLPSADSFKKGCCQLQAKVCAQITG